MSDATFTGPGGTDPGTFLLNVAHDAVPTVGDAIYAAQRQKARIIERTLRGVDVNEVPFEPYDETRAYYWYPNGRVGRTKAEVKRNKTAVKRLLKKFDVMSDEAGAVGVDLGSGGRATRGGVAFMNPGNVKDHHKVLWRGKGVVLVHDPNSRTGGQGIRFDSYADFKRSLGRTNVDLMGPRAPHMLQAMAVNVGGMVNMGDDKALSVTDLPEPATEVRIGIYGEEAGRATAHNTGYSPKWKSQHKREFLGASATDIEAMQSDIEMRAIARLKLKGLK